MTEDLELKEINQYYGTENYYNLMGGLKSTDGVAYIMNNGYSWFVTDFNVVWMCKAEIKKEEFLAIKLKLKSDKATMEVSDGNEKKLYTQHYEWTNCKKEVTLFCCNNVLMLSGEY